MSDLNLGYAIEISRDGKVILSDADLLELEMSLEVTSAGGGNERCSNSANCDGTYNRTCSNSGSCDRASNSTACSGTQVDS